MEVIRKVTEWLLPGLECPCCGTVTFAEPPPGAHAGSVSYGPVLNAAAVLLTVYGNVPPERAAQVMAMLLGVPVSPGWVDKASARLAAQLARPGSMTAMLAALAGQDVLAADETPVNVLDKNAPAAASRRREEQDPEEKEKAAAGAPHVLIVRTPDGRLTLLQALGSRRKGDVAAGIPAAFTGLPDDRRLHRLPASSHPAGRHPAVLPAHNQPMPGSHQARPRRPAVLGRRDHRHPARGAPGRRRRPCPRQHRPGAELLDKLRERYDDAVAFGITHNRLRDWHEGNHPGYALGCWLREYKEQVFLFTRDFAVDWTNDLASYCTSCGGWRVGELAGRFGGCRAGGFSMAGGSDILPWRAGAPGCAVGVAAA